uniref:Uncharacterized protein n=1 Tax=viral metagenome TaxID=1070528 RepID=A0A6C0JPX5_9ZZZZ
MSNYLYFYENIDKLINDDLLLSTEEEFVKVEDIFNINLVNLNIEPTLLDDNNIMLLYLLCIHKISTFKHDNIVRHKLIQFFNFHKGKSENKEQKGGSHFILLNILKKHIRNKIYQIQPKPKHLE